MMETLKGSVCSMTTFTIDKRTKERFDTNPERFIEKAIKKFVKTSPLNRLESFGGELIFDQPLIGFADSDDLLFAEYKKVVHEHHLSPKEMLTLHLTETLKDKAPQLVDVSVISFVLPINRETLRVNAREKKDHLCAGIIHAGRGRTLLPGCPHIWYRF